MLKILHNSKDPRVMYTSVRAAMAYDKQAAQFHIFTSEGCPFTVPRDLAAVWMCMSTPVHAIKEIREHFGATLFAAKAIYDILRANCVTNTQVSVTWDVSLVPVTHNLAPVPEPRYIVMCHKWRDGYVDSSDVERLPGVGAVRVFTAAEAEQFITDESSDEWRYEKLEIGGTYP